MKFIQRGIALMKNNLLIAFSILVSMLIACQAVTFPIAPPTPLAAVTAEKDKEFTLAKDQTATVTGTGLTIRLIGVAGDQRCPSEIECAMSGPVSISLSVQKDNGSPTNIDLQTFTDNDGRAPAGQFEGINSRATVEGYSIQVMGVTPYPAKPSKPIKSLDYRVILTVAQE
jgi:hypothetical protein